MGGKTLQNSRPKKYGKGGRRCRVCGNQGGGMIRKYNMNICRQCFRQYAADIGFQNRPGPPPSGYANGHLVYTFMDAESFPQFDFIAPKSKRRALAISGVAIDSGMRADAAFVKHSGADAYVNPARALLTVKQPPRV
ncbi:ribosomal protein [Aureococcus anophagefferens]|nr:ribosomal protein [Aureococcus anophagefferens]